MQNSNTAASTTHAELKGSKKDTISIAVSGGLFLGEYENQWGNNQVAEFSTAVQNSSSATNGISAASEQPLREDPFDTLKEILSLTQGKNHLGETSQPADLLILAGDIFTTPSPSTQTLSSALNLLQKDVLGDKDIEIMTKLFIPNYSLKDINIGMVIFAIHGSCDGPLLTGQNSALDILHYSNYLNYVGKTPAQQAMTASQSLQTGAVTITPIIIDKGNTKLSLYFLSHIKEVRLSKLLAQDKLKFFDIDKPSFKILVLNQKREHQKTEGFPKSAIHIKDFPSGLFDLIIWGGEPESLPEVELLEDGTRILTPGSASLHSFDKSDVGCC